MLSLEFRDECPAVEVEAAVSRIERRIRDRHPEVTRVFVEAQRADSHRAAEPRLTGS